MKAFLVGAAVALVAVLIVSGVRDYQARGRIAELESVRVALAVRLDAALVDIATADSAAARSELRAQAAAEQTAQARTRADSLQRRASRIAQQALEGGRAPTPPSQAEALAATQEALEARTAECRACAQENRRLMAYADSLIAASVARDTALVIRGEEVGTLDAIITEERRSRFWNRLRPGLGIGAGVTHGGRPALLLGVVVKVWDF